jgi:hypothetical protein
MKYVVIILFGFLGLPSLGQVLGPVIYSCDFANGIPADWTSFSDTGISQWEYRGPSTTPNNTVGARGSCSFSALPINSTTQSNGFIIFDSNYWDDGGTVCANIGSGVDPGPHNAYVQLPDQDFTNYNGLILTFQQQFRHFLDSTFVEVSVNNGANWSIVYLNQGAQSPQSQWVNINLSSIATGYDQVKIRFHYTGTYYWWLLDDIYIYEPYENDMRINSSKYTTNNGINSATPLLDLEYDQYPSVMIPSFRFQTNASNIGAFDQTTVGLNLRIVRDDGVQTYNQNSPSSIALAGSTSNYTITAPYLNPANLGDYDIFYQIFQSQADDNIINNYDTLDYTISPYTYARDEGPCETFFSGVSLFDGYLMQAGNVFQSRSFGRVINAVGVAVGRDTPVNTPIKAVIYKEDFEGIWAESDIHYVNYAELNDIGEEKIVVLPLATPLITYSDSIYIAMVSELSGEDDLHICRSGTSPEETSFLYYPTQSSFFYFINTPVVRLHIFASNAVPGCNKPEAENYDPLATIDDGTCRFPGCAHDDADNYDPLANWDDGTCIIGGCMDPLADNFHPYATYESNNCIYIGCTDPVANNYEPGTNQDDGSCVYVNAFFQINTLSGCAPLSIQVSNQTVLQEESICTFTLNDEPVLEACLSDFEYLIVNPGIYTLTYNHTAGEYSSSYSVEIEVLASPAAPVIVDNGDQLTCLTCADNAITWMVNDTELVGPTGSVLPYWADGVSQNGIYNIVLTNGFGCNSQGNQITIFNASLGQSEAVGCAPFQVGFENLTIPVSTMVCTLSYGDGLGEGDWVGEIQHVYDLPGNYEAILTCTDGLLLAADTVYIAADQPVDINVYWNNISEQVICENAELFETITWYVGASTYSGEGPFEDEVGTWTVVGETAGGCISSQNIDVVAINEVEKAVQLSVHPNPSDGVVQIICDLQGMCEFCLLNQLGECVWQKQQLGAQTQSLDWSNLPSGAYHLRVKGDQGIGNFPLLLLTK